MLNKIGGAGSGASAEGYSLLILSVRNCAAHFMPKRVYSAARHANYAVITKGAALANAAQHADLEPVLADAEAAGALALELAVRTFGYLFQRLVGLRCKMS